MKRLFYGGIGLLIITIILIMTACGQKTNHDSAGAFTKDYYSIEDFHAIIVGESTYDDVYDIAPTGTMQVTSYGGMCEYPAKDRGYIRIKFYGSELLVGSIEIVPSETEMPIYSYTDNLQDDILQYKGTLSELLTQYPTEYVRQLENGYRVVYYGDSTIAVVLFDVDGNNPVQKIYKMGHPRSVYDGLKIGQSLSEVHAIDPDGDYWFLVTGRNDFPKYSTHYTADQYVVSIQYDDDNLITQIIIDQI
jgi:hypothetical protein